VNENMIKAIRIGRKYSNLCKLDWFASYDLPRIYYCIL